MKVRYDQWGQGEHASSYAPSCSLAGVDGSANEGVNVVQEHDTQEDCFCFEKGRTERDLAVAKLETIIVLCWEVLLTWTEVLEYALVHKRRHSGGGEETCTSVRPLLKLLPTYKVSVHVRIGDRNGSDHHPATVTDSNLSRECFQPVVIYLRSL